MAEHPELQFESQPALRQPHLVVAWAGWNDAGEAASTAARYMAATMDAEPFASIDPEEFYDFTEARPLARYRDGEREIMWPSTDFYAVPLPTQDHDAILAVGIEPNFRWKRYMGAMQQLMTTMDVRLVVTLGAVASGITALCGHSTWQGRAGIWLNQFPGGGRAGRRLLLGTLQQCSSLNFMHTAV